MKSKAQNEIIQEQFEPVSFNELLSFSGNGLKKAESLLHARISFKKLYRYYEQYKKNNEVWLNQDICPEDLNDWAHRNWEVPGELHQLKNYREEIECMLNGLTPIFDKHSYALAVATPLNPIIFYRSDKLMEIAGSIDEEYELFFESEDHFSEIIMRACAYIINRYHNLNLRYGMNPVLAAVDKKSGLLKYYRAEIISDFVEVVPKEEVVPLEDGKLQELLTDLTDVDRWKRYIQPEKYTFSGVELFYIGDETKVISKSHIQESLHNKAFFQNKKVKKEVRNNLSALLQIPDLDVGFISLEYGDASSIYLFDRLNFSIVEEAWRDEGKFNEQIFKKFRELKKPLLFGDISNAEENNFLIKAFLKKDLKNILFVPLRDEEEGKGVLELASTKPYNLNAFSARKLRDLIPMFQMVMQRLRDDVVEDLNRVIQENYTAIHPSVEWKFVRTAAEYLLEQHNGNDVRLQPIIFRDVYPLYGQYDIVSSTYHRNEAIKKDLTENLQLARTICKQIYERFEHPLLDQLDYKIDEMEKNLEEFDGQTETAVVYFITSKVNPFLKQIRDSDPLAKDLVNTYFKQVDPDMEMRYRHRRDYEVSVKRINKYLSRYMDEEEKKIQKLVPHYFERYRTDGISYNIYAGQSLMPKGEFDKVMLNNLRLWQLTSMAEMTKKLHVFKDELPFPLDCAQLILVNGDSLTIKFRMDEKHFDVDGAYNAKYEILKKRIDKSVIAGTEERLTRPNTIAIVLENMRDFKPYREFFDYLLAKELILDVEELEIEPMQDVSGLKAFRLHVIVETKRRPNQ